jgi:hypothetical protein
MPEVSTERIWLTPDQLAERLQITPIVVRRWRHDNMGPRYTRLAHKTVRYALDDVEAWEREQRDNTPPCRCGKAENRTA